MKITYLNNNSKFDSKGKALALGFFDGIHRAHMKILKQTIDIAEYNHIKSAMITFDTSVACFVRNQKFRYLTSNDDKISIAKEIGFDEIVFIEVNQAFCDVSKEDCCKLLFDDADFLVCGFDFSFGQYAAGDVAYLEEKYGDKVVAIDEMKIDGIKVGSQAIKKALSEGDLYLARVMLKRDYLVKGLLHKRNKNYSLSVSDYFLPKNGKYEIIVRGLEGEVTINAKIKFIEDESVILIKDLDDSHKLDKLETKKVHDVIFTKTSSK